MKLNRTLAVALHRAMWTDMQTELGDNPSPEHRAKFKLAWIKEHFPNECIMHNCFLCEYAFKGDNPSCSACPIRWPGGHCGGSNFSYRTAPISDILALPEKGECRANMPDDCKKYVANDKKAAATAYYRYREEMLSRASGLPGSVAIEDHIKAIQEKAIAEKAADVIDDFLYRCEKYPDTPVNAQLKKRLCAIQEKAVRQSKLSEIYGDTKMELAKASGRPAADSVTAHIKAIQEKAVEEYFDKTPGAKLASMDVDNAFKQYAKEQKAPIFKELAAASGLSECYESVSAHIYEIKRRAKQDGRDYERERIMDKIGEMLNDKSAGETKNS